MIEAEWADHTANINEKNVLHQNGIDNLRKNHQSEIDKLTLANMDKMSEISEKEHLQQLQS